MARVSVRTGFGVGIRSDHDAHGLSCTELARGSVKDGRAELRQPFVEPGRPATLGRFFGCRPAHFPTVTQ